MITLVLFLEEPSAKALLEGLLPRLLPMRDISLRFVVFEGKQDLEKQIVRKIRVWRLPDTRFVVLRDQDSADCQDVKESLVKLCQKANHPEALVRVACREIESWYLGDLEAVGRALDLPHMGKHQESKKYRDPDNLSKPSRELELLSAGRYQKVSGSRAIGLHIELDGRNRSHSFGVFLQGLRRIAIEAS